MPSSPCCDVIRWADIALPTSTSHQLNTGTAQTYHQCLLNLQSWLETLTAVIQTGDVRRLIWTGSLCKSGHWTATVCCCTTPSNMARSTLQGGNVTARQTCAGSQWQTTVPASSMVLGDFPHSQHRLSVIHIGVQLPIIRGVQRRRWNLRKADWASYTVATERSIPLIPVNNISVEKSYQRFCGAMQKVARHSIPRAFCPMYTPCLDEECQDLLKQYEERHSWPSHRVTQCSTPAPLGRTDVKDELHAIKTEELGTDTSAWYCLTTTQFSTSISQRQCRC